MQTPAVLDLVRSTRAMLLPSWGNVEERTKNGNAHSIVTDLDLKIERYLADALKKIEPGAEFAGEEFGGSRDTERFWLCDPIDGTAHFTRGLPFCSVMLALIEEGRVNFSCIYDFVNDQLYHALRGGGAFCNGLPIRVSDRPLSRAYVSFESRIDRPSNYEIQKRLRASAVIFSSITAGYEFALVASGKLEGRICLDGWGNDWDFAPGTLLVEEAGGIVTNIGSHTYDFRNLNLIAANPLVYRELTGGPDALFPFKD